MAMSDQLSNRVTDKLRQMIGNLTMTLAQMTVEKEMLEEELEKTRDEILELKQLQLKDR